MKIRIPLFLVFAISLFTISSLKAQKIWTKVNKEIYHLQKKEVLKKPNFPKEFKLLSFDAKSFSNTIKAKKKPTLSLPNLEGGFSEYVVKETSSLSLELSKKFPMIKSYTAYGLDNPNSIAKISIGTDGFHAVVFTAGKKTLYVDPYSKDKKEYISYSRGNLNPEDKEFACMVEESAESINNNSMLFRSNANGFLRTFRLALACTGEYAQFHLTRQNISTTATTVVKKAAVLSAMNTSITRVNAIMEKDLSVRLNIIDNNEEIIFLDPNTDNLTNSNEGVLIGEIQFVIDGKVGNTNYDIGHVFSTGDNAGIASFRSVCKTSTKAQGVTGRLSPVGDAYDIDFVIHEIGHQFGANHTFNNSCNDNRNSTTAVEPGSGSTIMAYTGICAPNLQTNSDDYFHAISITEMLNYIQSSATCFSSTATGNSSPIANAGEDYSIPKATPFLLKGSATDSDGVSNLIYNWEQTDIEIATMPPSPSSIGGPLFRSLPSKATPNRYMPALANVISGTTSLWEVIPSVARNLNFSLTVRDNHVGGGGISRDDMKVSVLDATPFEVVSQTTSGVVWKSGFNETIIWNKGASDVAPINCKNVNILLSLDGGLTFPIVLKANTPNDGNELITVPNNPTADARIMVQAADNIFYNVNSSEFTIESSVPTFKIANTSGLQSACNSGNQTVSYTLNFDFVNGFSENVSLTATGQPSVSTVTFTPSSISSDGNVTMNVSNLNGVSPQDYVINVVGNSNSVSENLNVSLKITTNNLGIVNLTSPLNNTLNVDLNTDLKWSLADNASSYDVQVATDSGFTNIISSGNVLTNLYSLTDLSVNTTYFWRVKPKNNCSEGNYSSAFSFNTLTPNYCSSTFTDESGGTEHITNVVFNTINNTSGNDTVDGYEDFTSIKTNVKRGDTHQVSVTFDTVGFRDQCFVYIDWNRDYIFDANTEMYDLGKFSSPLPTATKNITVPSDAVFGETRMRVFIEYYDDSTLPGGGACDANHLTEWGETEDYTIIVDNTASVNDVAFDGFNLYPNPTKGEFTVNLQTVDSNKISIQLIDVAGRLVDKKVFTNVGGYFSEKIFFDRASSGIYLLKITNGYKQTTRKLILK